MRAGSRFRVVLHAEERECLVTQTFERLVVQINVGQLDLVRVDGVGIDGEIVVVRSDFNLACSVVLNRMVAAVVAEFELVSAPAEGEATELGAQTDSKNRHAAQIGKA